MKKFLALCFSLLSLQYVACASEEKSICEKIKNYGTALYVYTERCLKTDDQILIDAAGFKNLTTLRYCLDNGIGSLFVQDLEGRTALETARLRSDNEAVEIIMKKLRQQKHQESLEKNNVYSDDSDSDCTHGSPTSITRRRIAVQQNLKSTMNLLLERHEVDMQEHKRTQLLLRKMQ